MKIIYIYQYFGTPAGSWSTRVYEFTKRWVKEGHNVTVITSPYDKSDIKSTKFIDYQKIEGINLIVINSGDSNRFSKIKRVYRSVIFSIVSIWFASTKKADVVLASSGPITVGIPGLLAKWFSGKNLIFEVRDLWPSGAIEMGLLKGLFAKVGLWFEKLLYQQANKIIVCSEGMEDYINERYDYFGNKIGVVPNVANENLLSSSTELLPDWARNGKNKVFLYAGSLGIMDAVHEAIEGFLYDEIPENIHLVIIGDGVERTKLEKRVLESNKSNQIHFLGLIPKTEVYQWYGVAFYSLVLFADYKILETSSPNKLFDSIATGVPIIQNTSGWMAEMLSKNQAGFNIKTRLPKEYSNLFLNTDESLREKHVKGLKLLQEKYSIERVATNYLNKIESANG